MLANQPLERSDSVAEFSLGLNSPNEDSVFGLYLGAGRSVAAVADGVGGLPQGNIASGVAVRVVSEELTRDFKIKLDLLFEKVASELGKELPTVSSATTLTLVRCDGKNFDVGHVGDSRAYHLRGFGIQDLTEDQNEGQALIRQGVFTKRDIQKYPRRNVLTSALSKDKSYKLFQNSGVAQSGDRMLIVSDGVYEVFQRQELAALNDKSASVTDFVETLKRELKSRGLRDDSSVACIQID